MSDLPKTAAEAKAVGNKTYVSGKPCPRGHNGERYASNKSCVECLMAKNALPEKVRYKSEWYQSAKDRLDPIQKQRYLANRDIELKKRKENYLKNREKRLEQTAQWRKENWENVLQRHSVYCRNRRSVRKNAGGTHSKEDIAAILSAQKCRCGYCGKPVGKIYHVDHIVSLKRGGSNDKRNLQILCPNCNLRKSAKDPLQFAREMGKLL